MKNNFNFDLSKNIIVFYHEFCLDGFTSAYIANKKFKNKAEYIPLSYSSNDDNILKEKNIKIKDLKDKEIYFLDFCLDKNNIEKILKVAKKLIILDHHIGAKDIVSNIDGSVFGNTEKGESGAVVASKYFFPNEKISNLIKYVSIGDTYYFSKNENQRKIEENTLSYIHSFDFDFKVFSKLEKDLENKIKFKQIKEIGEILNRNFNKLIDQQLKNAKLINFEGYEIYAINNSSIFTSRLGNKLAELSKDKFAISYLFQNNLLKISLRGKGKINLSELAKKFGGGGHFNAASFILSDKKFVQDFINKIIS